MVIYLLYFNYQIIKLWNIFKQIFKKRTAKITSVYYFGNSVNQISPLIVNKKIHHKN